MSEDDNSGDEDGRAGREQWWNDITRRALAAVPTLLSDRGSLSDERRVMPFAADRLLALCFVLVFVGGVLATLGDPAWVPYYPTLLGAVYVGLWLFVGMYALATGVWAYEAYLGWRHDPPPLEYGPEDVQVRILTVAAEDVVQQTVDALPEALTDRHVVAEAPLDIDGATVHVVPDEFSCDAADKGRALEWARRELACDREFSLFLDEDTLVTEFEGLPDADIVQFRERPVFTGSYLTYWSEVLRMGYQTEQTGFPALDIPLYAWGGGIAVRRSVEESVTWDFETLIEDTVFAWQAAREGADFETMDTKFRNQAPPSPRAMFEQRRRWLTGTLRDEAYLPRGFQALMTIRNVAWAFSPATTFLVLFSGAIPTTTPGRGLFRIVAWTMFGFSLIWVWRGWRYYEGPSLRTLPVFLCYPLVVAAHSAGAVWAFFSPPESFETTTKADESVADDTDPTDE